VAEDPWQLVADLQSENAGLRAIIAEQAQLIDKLVAEVTELKARLAINSRNSSKPPSSDGYAKPAPKSRRTRSGKKPGKQRGDPGRHLAQRPSPDVTLIHQPEHCAGCGSDLADTAVVGMVRRQVFDLPPVALLCTEHQGERRRCGCGTETTAAFPADATAPACYGPALRAYVCYLVTRQHIPIARVAELLRDTYGATVSTGTIMAMVEQGAAMLDEFLTQIRDRLQDSDVVHADETGLRVEAALAWVHSVSTTALTLYHLDPKRGTAAMDAMGVLEHLGGVLVHDGWVPYRHYTGVDHALCNAHHLRELDAAAGTGNQAWATDMVGLLCDTWQQVCTAKTNGDTELGVGDLDRIHADYRTIIAAGHRTNPPPVPTGKRGRPKRTKAANLLLRLDTHTGDVLRFATDFTVPFDNNLAERDIRMVKVHQKISGGFRSTHGAQAFLALRSYLSTATKQGVNQLDALHQLFNQNVWIPTTTGPAP